MMHFDGYATYKRSAVVQPHWIRFGELCRLAGGLIAVRTFKVFSSTGGRYKAVKDGWCWPAFVFGSIWALFSGLWIIAIIILPIEMVLSVLNGVLEKVGGSYDQSTKDIKYEVMAALGMLAIIIRIIFGARGNRWRERKLYRMGYVHALSVKAPDKCGAIALCKSSESAAGESRSMAEPVAQPLGYAPQPMASSDEGGHNVNSQSSDDGESQARDNILLLLAAIMGIAVCMTGVGLIPSGILLFGLAASIKGENLHYLKFTTRLVSGFGYIVAIITAGIGVYWLIMEKYPADGYVPYGINERIAFSFFITLLSIGAVVALKYIWLNPLIRQFDTIRLFVLDKLFPSIGKGHKRPGSEESAVRPQGTESAFGMSISYPPIWLSWLIACASIFAIVDMPYGYYQLLRILVTGYTGYMAFLYFKRGPDVWAWSLAFIAVIYNPIFIITMSKDVHAIGNLFVAAIIAWEVKKVRDIA